MWIIGWLRIMLGLSYRVALHFDSVFTLVNDDELTYVEFKPNFLEQLKGITPHILSYSVKHEYVYITCSCKKHAILAKMKWG